MPIYVYKCTECFHEFEEIQKITDNVLPPCPECDSRVEKQITGTNFALKGNGWFKDGYQKPTPPKIEE